MADTRKEHASARALVEKNIDPGQHRKAETQKTIAATKNTFKAVALSFIEENTEQDNPKKWAESYAKKVRRILDRDVFRQPPYTSSRYAVPSSLSREGFASRIFKPFQYLAFNCLQAN